VGSFGAAGWFLLARRYYGAALPRLSPILTPSYAPQGARWPRAVPVRLRFRGPARRTSAIGGAARVHYRDSRGDWRGSVASRVVEPMEERIPEVGRVVRTRRSGRFQRGCASRERASAAQPRFETLANPASLSCARRTRWCGGPARQFEHEPVPPASWLAWSGAAWARRRTCGKNAGSAAALAGA
jgi:hypothetical protein